MPIHIHNVAVHPTEAKRVARIPPSKPVPNVTRRVCAVLPFDIKESAREGTLECLTVLENCAAFQLIEYHHHPANILALQRIVSSCGVVVNGLQEVDDKLWKLFRDARTAGVLVLNYDCPGLYLAHENHVDLHASVPKYLPLNSINLETRCETREDRFREVIIHVVSGPDMGAERLLLRNKILPILTERCQTRRVRIRYLDLRDDAANCGPGLHLRTAEAARHRGLHVVLLSGKFEPECGCKEKLTRFIAKLPKGEEQAKFDWIHSAPEDYNRFECVLAHLLQLANTPVFTDRNDVNEPSSSSFEMNNTGACSGGDMVCKSSQATRGTNKVQSEQHTLVYFRDSSFITQILKDDVDNFYSSDAYERERVGSLLSALYAHPFVSIRPYHANYAPPIGPDRSGLLRVMPGYAVDLDNFAADVLEDLWSRIALEFSQDPSKIVQAYHKKEVEHAFELKNQFYFPRTSEHTVMKYIKLGRPGAIFIKSTPGGGVTSVLQRCMVACASLCTHINGATHDEIIILSAFSGVFCGNYTPLKVFQHLATCLKEKCSYHINIPGTFNGARTAFLDLIRFTVNSKRRVVIFIDDITNIENPRDIAWLFHEDELPSGLQMVIGGHQIEEGPLLPPNQRHRNSIHKAAIDYVPSKHLQKQAVLLNACVPEAMELAVQIRPMQYSEQKLFLTKYLSALNIEPDDDLVAVLLNKPGISSITFAKLLVECLRSIDLDSVDLLRQVDELPGDIYTMLQNKLDNLETIFPASMLARLLPIIVFGSGSLTLDDIKAMMGSLLQKRARVHVDSIIATALLWQARHFIQGPFNGTYRCASKLAACVVLRRYVKSNEAKCALYQILAEYYGESEHVAEQQNKPCLPAVDTTGEPRTQEQHAYDITQDHAKSHGYGLLTRMHQLPSHVYLDWDEHARLIDPDLFQSQRMVVNTLLFLPYYLTQAQQFNGLCALLCDFSFLQAKLELGEGTSLVDDFDRVILYPHPPWLEQHSEEPRDPYADNFCFDSRCHARAFRAWSWNRMSDNTIMHRRIIAFRNFIWRNLSFLQRRPHLILQSAMNSPGISEPSSLAKNELQSGSYAQERHKTRFEDAKPGEKFFLLWENKPDDAPVKEMCDQNMHKEAVTTCIWLDSTSFVSGGKDGTIFIWSSVTGECMSTLAGHTHCITGLISMDIPGQGPRIASASRDCTLRLWRYQGDVGRTSQVLRSHNDMILSIDFASATGELVSAGCDRIILVWDLNAAVVKLKYKIQTTHAGPILSVRIAPNANILVTASSDSSLQVWSMTNKTPLRGRSHLGTEPCLLTGSWADMALRLQGHLAAVTCCCFDRSGNSLATGSHDHSIMLWDPFSGIHTGALFGHKAAVTDVHYDVDGCVLVSTSMDHHIRLWDRRSGSPVVIINQGCVVCTARFSPDGSLLLVGAEDCTVCVWSWVGRDGSSSMGLCPQERGLFLSGNRTRPRDDFTKYHCDSLAGIIRDRDKEKNTYSCQPTGHIHSGSITAIASLRSTVFLPEQHGSAIENSKINSSDQSIIITGGEDSFIRKIAATGDNTICKVQKTFKGHAKQIRSIATDPHMSKATSASDDGTLRTWNIHQGHDSSIMTGHVGPVLTCCYADSGNMVLSGGKDRVIRVWDTKDDSAGVQVTSFCGHTRQVTGLACDYSYNFFSASADRLVRLWDLTTGNTVQTFSGHEGGITSISLLHGASLSTISTSRDHSTMLWDSRKSYTHSNHLWKVSYRNIPVACSTCEIQPWWIAVCEGEMLHVYDARMWQEIACFQGISNLTCAAFHGTGALLCGDEDGRLCSLTFFHAPAQGWI